MAFIEGSTAKGNLETSDPNHDRTSPHQNHGVETSPKVNVTIDLDDESATMSSGLEATLKADDTSSPGEQSFDHAPLSSTASTKAEKNRRKKENAKKRKAEEKQREKEEAAALAGMRIMSLHERALAHAGPNPLPSQLKLPTSHEFATPSGRANGQQLRDSYDGPAMRLWEIKDAGARGLGVFATTFIKKGTAIFQEVPLIIGGPSWLDKEASFIALGEEKQRDFMALHSRCYCGKTPRKETEFQRIWDDNSFDVSKVAAKGHIAVYKIASRLNHACIPNAQRRYTKNGNVVMLATKNIKQGDEITINYIGSYSLPVPIRRQLLFQKFGIHCDCRGCIENTVLPLSRLLASVEDSLMTADFATPEILGEHTAEEVAALAKVEPWYQAFKQRLDDLTIKLQLEVLCDHVQNGKNRMLLIDNFVHEVKSWLESNNQCRLSEEVIKHYLLIDVGDVAATMDDYIGRYELHQEQGRRNGS